jgi:hypothetical protein
MRRKRHGQRAGVKQFARGLKKTGAASVPPTVIIPRLEGELEVVLAASAAASDKVRRQIAAKRARDEHDEGS